MRSRMARAGARVAVLVTVALVSGTSAVADAAPAAAPEDQMDGLSALGGPVGLLAVGLGVVGMVTGVLRRRRGGTTADPANQRKS